MVLNQAVLVVLNEAVIIIPGRTGPGGPDAPVVELGFQGREEALCHRVVPANTGQSHGAGDPVSGGELSDLR